MYGSIACKMQGEAEADRKIPARIRVQETIHIGLEQLLRHLLARNPVQGEVLAELLRRTAWLVLAYFEL